MRCQDHSIDSVNCLFGLWKGINTSDTTIVPPSLRTRPVDTQPLEATGHVPAFVTNHK